MPLNAPDSFEFYKFEKSDDFGYIRHSVNAKIINTFDASVKYKATSILLVKSNNLLNNTNKCLEKSIDFSSFFHRNRKSVITVTILNNKFNTGFNMYDIINLLFKIDILIHQVIAKK